MKITLQYGQEVAVFPAAALSVIGRAQAEDLRVLLCLCADRTAREDMARLCSLSGCSEAQVLAALAFWRGAGIVTAQEGDASPTEPEPAPTLAASTARSPQKRDTLPTYTTEELTDLLERRTEAAALINECQHVLGRVFNTREVSILMAMLDYMALSPEYLVLLCAHCAELGKTSLHYIERVAQDMVRGGADTVEALQETLHRLEQAKQTEGQIRTIFGLGGRKLTQAEQKYISNWTGEWGFSMEMIERAYETTVNSTETASMRYADGVLKRWHAEGLMTPEAVEQSDERWRASQAEKGKGSRAGKGQKPEFDHSGGSFDTDDFFNAALHRSFDDL